MLRNMGNWKFLWIALAVQTAAANATMSDNAIADFEDKIPTSCVEAFQGTNRSSGVHRIQVADSGLDPFDVYCLEDPNKGLPWTVLQRRVDIETNFNRSRHDYKVGFGDFNKTFMLGFEKWHVLTTQGQPQELWLQLTDNVTANGYYDRFAIGNETDKYDIKILGEYSGDAGVVLWRHHGSKWIARNVNNDLASRKSAFWQTYYLIGNLNGEYETTDEETGPSMKYAHMAIRPAQK